MLEIRDKEPSSSNVMSTNEEEYGDQQWARLTSIRKVHELNEALDDNKIMMRYVSVKGEYTFSHKS